MPYANGLAAEINNFVMIWYKLGPGYRPGVKTVWSFTVIYNSVNSFVGKSLALAHLERSELWST